MKTLKLIVSAALLFNTFISFGQNTKIWDLNKKLGKGINLGNMFEAPSETAWGNPFKDNYLKIIADQGFSHVRMPITWDVPDRAQQVAPYKITDVFLKRVKHVVDLALSNKLSIIINMHHHNLLFDKPDTEKEKFLKQWEQIAEYFKDYDDRVVFEILNEPHGNLVPDKWNVFLVDALNTIRKTNPTRAVMIGTANYGGLGGLSALKLPKDDNLILTIHYYDPFQFTHQGAEWVGTQSKDWLGTKWTNNEIERVEIEGQFAQLKEYSIKNNVPVNIGEFGAYSTADLESRVLWTNYMARFIESQGYSWAYWEFSAGFGIYNPTTDKILAPLADALLKDPLKPATTIKSKALYEANFTNGFDWNFYVAGQAQGSAGGSNKTAVVNLNQASTESWHAQFVKQNIKLKKDYRYIVSFKIKGNLSKSGSVYLGRDGNPYDAYSSYIVVNAGEVERPYIFSFVKVKEDDAKARMVFDFGTSTGKIEISDIKIEEEVKAGPVEEVKILATEKIKHNVVNYYPNPVDDYLILTGLHEGGKAEVLNQKGLVLKSFNIINDYEKLDFSGITGGIYFLKIYNHDNENVMVKLIKL